MAVILHRNDLPEQRPQHRVSGGAEMMESSDQRKPFPGQSVWTLISMISYLQFFWFLLWSIAALATLHAFLGQVVKLMHEVACLRDQAVSHRSGRGRALCPLMKFISGSEDHCLDLLMYSNDYVTSPSFKRRNIQGEWLLDIGWHVCIIKSHK